MTQPIKRKKVFVSRAIQGRILARIVKYWLVCSLSLWHALFLIELARYTIPGLGTRAPRFSPLEAYAQFASQHATLLIASALVFPVILWDMLKLTHQIAGPLVRFEHTLRKMTAGE